jgi:hypothetical protein
MLRTGKIIESFDQMNENNGMFLQFYSLHVNVTNFQDQVIHH